MDIFSGFHSGMFGWFGVHPYSGSVDIFDAALFHAITADVGLNSQLTEMLGGLAMEDVLQELDQPGGARSYEVQATLKQIDFLQVGTFLASHGVESVSNGQLMEWATAAGQSAEQVFKIFGVSQASLDSVVRTSSAKAALAVCRAGADAGAPAHADCTGAQAEFDAAMLALRSSELEVSVPAVTVDDGAAASSGCEHAVIVATSVAAVVASASLF